MRLRTKLTLIIAVASVVPTVAATLVGRDLVRRRSQAEFKRLLTDGEAEVRARLEQLRQEVEDAAKRLADPEDQLIGPILIAQARGGIDDTLYRRLVHTTPRVMQERGLEVLAVMGSGGEVLASGHYPGRMGDHDPVHKDRARKVLDKDAILLSQRLMLGNKAATRLTVQAWRLVRSPLGVKVVVIAGRRLGPALAQRLRLRGGTVVRITGAKGEVLAGQKEWARFKAYPQRRIKLTDSEGRAAATITLAVPDDALRTTLSAINVAAGALAGSGLVLALLLGLLTARRITRPLQEVAEGAARVAAGDLDVRLRVRGKDEMGQLMAAFNQRVAELRDAREQLVAAERVAAWQEIARRMAHEIKNPLFPIQTSIETLQRVYDKKHPDLDEIFAESTTTILEEVERLKNIVGEFSRFARLPKPQPQPLDLKELLPSITGLYADAQVPVQVEIPGDLPTVMADRDQLTQVLVNLLQNAQDALMGQEDPRITLDVRADDDWMVLRVADNGPGFDEQLAARIFTPYFTTKQTKGGTGLGLAIAHRVITDHGGQIEARSVPGEGAVFTVRLPLEREGASPSPT